MMMSEGGEEMEVKVEKKEHSRIVGECSVAGEWTGQKKPRTSFSAAAEEEEEFTEDYDITWEECSKILADWSIGSPDRIDRRSPMSSKDYDEMLQRLGIYSLRGDLVERGWPQDKLDDESLKKMLETPGPFPGASEPYQKRRFLWVFLRSDDLDLDDYQRLIIGDSYEFMNDYSGYYCKYETDKAYLVYYEALSKKIKWIKKHACLDEQSLEWLKYREVAYKQAARAAEGLTHLTCKLFHVGIQEYIWNTRWEYRNRDLEGLYFELWKLVVKEQKTFSDALKAIYGEKLFPSHNFTMGIALRKLGSATDVSSEFKDDFDSYVACIPETIPEQEVRQKIKDASGEMSAKLKTYEFYIKKKIEFACAVGLIRKEVDSSAGDGTI